MGNYQIKNKKNPRKKRGEPGSGLTGAIIYGKKFLCVNDNTLQRLS